MNLYKNKQAGSVHAVIIGVLVVALLCALGWIFYQNVSSTQTAKSPSAHSSTKDKTTASGDSTYLDIQQWGVKLPYDSSKLPDGAKLTYEYAKDQNGGQVSISNTAGAHTIYRGHAGDVIEPDAGTQTFGELYAEGQGDSTKSPQIIKLADWYFVLDPLESPAHTCDASCQKNGDTVGEYDEVIQSGFSKLTEE